MPRIKETTVYKYNELSDKAKERARDWLRECNADDNFFAEHVTDEFHEALEALGFDVDKDKVAWSGFYSQGDGASFSGQWYASRFAPGKLLADRPATYKRDGKTETCKQNAELHRIAAELKACKQAGMERATIEGRDRWGFHMSVGNAEHDQPFEEATNDQWDAYKAACAAVEDRFIQAARDLAHAFWTTLRDEYEYQNSDEQIAESIVANEYEFDEEGRIA